MAQYIIQLRRGTKNDSEGRNDWQEYEGQPNYMTPLAGELVLEYDNGVPRLKIGDGTKSFSELPYMSVDSFLFSKVAKITLLGGDAWQAVEGFDNRYSQDITSQIADKITTHSKIDIQPTPEQLSAFHEKDVAFTTVNKNGQVRVCAIGLRPEGTYYDINVTISEVVESGVVIGNTTATPTPRSDWNQTDETKADFIKNKPTIGDSGLISTEKIAHGSVDVLLSSVINDYILNINYETLAFDTDELIMSRASLPILGQGMLGYIVLD